MTLKRGVIKLKDIVLETCFKSPTQRHHYRMPPPSGPSVEGVCKWCLKEQTHYITEDRAYDQLNRPRGKKAGVKYGEWKGFMPEKERG